MEETKLIRVCVHYKCWCQKCGQYIELGEEHPCQMPVVDRVETDDREEVAA